MKFGLLLVTLFFFLVSMFSVSALNTEHLLGYYSFDDSDTRDYYLDDYHGSSNYTDYGMTYLSGRNGTAGVITIGDYAGIDDEALFKNDTQPRTYSVWFNASSYTNNHMLFMDGDATAYWWLAYINTNTIQFAMCSGGCSTQTFTAPSTNEWHHYAITYNPSNGTVFLDGVAKGSIAKSQLGTSTDTEMYLGRDTYPLTGAVDEFSVWNIGLNQTDLQEIVDGWVYSAEPAVTPSVFNESIERTVQLEQTTPVEVNSNIYTTVYSADFTSDVGAYAYLTTTLQSVSTKDFVQYCRVIVNGTDYNTEQARSMTTGQTGNTFLFSTPFFVNGTYTAQVQCYRDAVSGKITVEHSTTHMHILHDSRNQTLTYANFTNTFPITSSSYQLLINSSFTTSTKEAGNLSRNLIMDGKVSYEYQSLGVLTLYAIIDDVASPEHMRYGGTASTGSGGGFLVSGNLSANTSYDVLLYGKSSAGNGNVTITSTMKEFINHDNESVQQNITGSTITTTAEAHIVNITISNEHAETKDYVVKASLSINATTASEVSLRFKQNGNTSQTYTRTMAAGQTGVIVMQQLFSDLSTDTNVIAIHGNITAGTATIDGGNLIAYSVNEEAPAINQFNVTVLNAWDNSSVNNFNVTTSEGLTVSTTTASIMVPYSGTTVNITIDAPGYYSGTVLNHATATNLTTTIDNTRTIFNGSILFLGTAFTNFTVNGSFWSESTTNGSLMLPLKADASIPLTISNDIAYYNFTYTTSYVNKTSYVYGLTFYNHLVNFSAVDVLTAAQVGNFSINLTYNGVTTNASTEGLFIMVPAITGYNMTSSIDADDYAIFNATHIFSGYNSTYVYNIYTTNSVNITYRHSDTGALLVGTVITTQFIGQTAQTNTTNTSFLYVDLFSPDDYTILSDATGYQQNKYEISIVNKSFQNLVLYMQPANNSQLVLITVTDRFGTELQDVEVIVQKWSNDAWITDQIMKTDFLGQTEAYYVLSTTFYNHVLKYNGQTVYGVINDDDNKKVIYTEDVNNGIRFTFDVLAEVSLDAYLDTGVVGHQITFTNTSNTSGYFRYYFSTSDNSQVNGTLQLYDGNTLLCSNSTTTATGTVFCGFTTTEKVYYKAVALVDGVIVDSYTVIFGYDGEDVPNFGSIGYVIAGAIVLGAMIAFIAVPTISLYVGAVAFILLSLLGLIFQSIGITALIGLLVIVYFVTSIPARRGET